MMTPFIERDELESDDSISDVVGFNEKYDADMLQDSDAGDDTDSSPTQPNQIRSYFGEVMNMFVISNILILFYHVFSCVIE